MLVTLITDASSCPDTLVAGYGYWCVSGHGKEGSGGILKGDIKDSYEAELKGAINALIKCYKKGLIRDHDTVLIQLDNKGVVGLLNKDHLPRKDLIEAMKIFQEFTLKHHLRILSRHVKGHTNKSDNRYAANRHCDERARAFMLEARSKAIPISEDNKEIYNVLSNHT